MLQLQIESVAYRDSHVSIGAKSASLRIAMVFAVEPTNYSIRPGQSIYYCSEGGFVYINGHAVKLGLREIPASVKY
jgi:hypothetical protein